MDPAMTALVNRLLSQGNPLEAIEVLELSGAADPEVLELRARAYADAGGEARALDYLASAARQHSAAGRLDAAGTLLTRVLAANPRHETGLMAWILLCQRLQDLQGVIRGACELTRIMLDSDRLDEAAQLIARMQLADCCPEVSLLSAELVVRRAARAT
ncbi:MAG: hypothetical protein AB1758_03490 [Candidatus Eremiobacterota bacterium]